MKYTIVPPSSTTVVNNQTVTILAVDSLGNIDSSESRSVLLLASGSAVGGGTISLVNGIGSALLHDSVAESITLSLVDISGTGFDATSTAVLIFAPGWLFLLFH